MGTKRKLIDAAMGLGLLCCIAGLLLKPSEAVASAADGIKLCLDVIVPSLFPFFVLSTLFVELGLAQYVGYALENVMRPVFNLSGPCSAAVVLGFIGGYPVGAKTAIALYEKGLCNKEEAERLLSFCNNSGPAFILGAVGAGIFASSRIGWFLYLSHTAASLLVGLFFRFYKPRSRSSPQSRAHPKSVVRLSDAFSHSVKSSFMSILNICAFVIFFTVVIRMLMQFGIIPGLAVRLGGVLQPFGMTAASAERLLTGLIEVTSGLWSLQGSQTQLAGRLSMAAFMLGWAGISIHCQVLSFLGESGLRIRTYIAGKMMHGALSGLLCLALLRFIGLDVPASSFLAQQVTVLARLDFGGALDVTLKVTMILTAAIVFCAALIGLKRNWKKM